MCKHLLKAAEDALLDVFRIGLESTNNGLRNASFHFVDSVLTDLGLKTALDDKLDRNIEKRAQPSSFMDVLIQRALKSTRFVR